MGVLAPRQLLVNHGPLPAPESKLNSDSKPSRYSSSLQWPTPEHCVAASTAPTGARLESSTSLSPEVSLNSLLRENNRERLYIDPLRWTSRHLQLLECRFVWQKRGEKPNLKPSQILATTDINVAWHRRAMYRAEKKLRSSSEEIRSDAVHDLFRYFGIRPLP